MVKHLFNGTVEGKKGHTRTRHYQGTAMVYEDKKTGLFHTSYDIHLHEGHGHRTSEDKHVTVVGEFTTQHLALQAALKHADKFFR